MVNVWASCGHLDNDENPGEADCKEKCAAHSQGSTREGEAANCECFWKTLKMQPKQYLESLEKAFSLDKLKAHQNNSLPTSWLVGWVYETP